MTELSGEAGTGERGVLLCVVVEVEGAAAPQGERCTPPRGLRSVERREDEGEMAEP